MNNKNRKTIVFIHGAYQSPWLWQAVIDDILLEKNIKYILISLPGYYKEDNSKSYFSLIAEDINTCISNETIYIVGHSLGAAFSCQLIEHINSSKIVLFLSSIPINIPKLYLDVRIFFEKILINTLGFIPVKIIPIFLRPKIITNYSKNNLLHFFLNDCDYVSYLCSQKSKIVSVNIGCGYMDVISGRIKNQKNMVFSLQKNNIKSKFYSFGVTGHYPYKLNKKRYVKWIIEGINEYV